MRIRVLALAAFTLSGCSAADGGNSNQQPTECMQSDRIGTYLAHWETLSGDCGNVSDQVVRNDVISSALPAGCTLDATDRWSDGECRLERAWHCDDLAGSGESASFVAATTQQTSDGDHLTGAVTITIRSASGTELCRGTYRVTYTRQ